MITGPWGGGPAAAPAGGAPCHAERRAGEGLEPRLLLRVALIRRDELEVEVRPRRVPGRADEPDGRPGHERRPGLHERIHVGEVAVEVRRAVGDLHREADAAAPRGRGVDVPDDAVRERVERRALGSDDVRGGVVVMVGSNRDDGRAAADGEDVAARELRRGEPAPSRVAVEGVRALLVGGRLPQLLDEQRELLELLALRRHSGELGLLGENELGDLGLDGLEVLVGEVRDRPPAARPRGWRRRAPAHGPRPP